MKLFNAFKYEIRILDDELTDPQQLLEWVMEAVAMYCEVNCVTGDVLDYKKDVISTEHCELAEA